MGLLCKISQDKGTGNISVTNDNGTQSRLYTQAVDFLKEGMAPTVQEQKKALGIWATASTEDFKELTGKDENTATLEDVLAFQDTLTELSSSLSPVEVYEVKSIMQRLGIETLTDFRDKLTQGFEKTLTGFKFSKSKAIKSKLFTLTDLESADFGKIQELIDKIDGELLMGNNFEVEADNKEVLYRDPNSTNSFGMSSFITEADIMSEVVEEMDSFQNKQDFTKAVARLPYTDFTEKVFTDDTYTDQLFERIKDLRRVPVVELRGNEFVSGRSLTAQTLRTTVPSSFNGLLALKAEVQYLKDIPEVIWDEKRKEVREVLKEIETDLAKQGVDVIGISDMLATQEQTIDLLDRLVVMLSRPNISNVDNFSELYDQIFDVKPATVVEKTDSRYAGYNIVKVYTSLPAQTLFDRFGLIKIAENTYHKVDTNTEVSDLYEYLYEQVDEGALVLPKEFVTAKKQDKVSTLKDIERFVNSRNTGLGFFNEKASLFQLAFNHAPLKGVNVKTDLAQIEDISANTDYLKTNFILDFYNEVLREKLKNSPIWKEKLSKFKFTDGEIQIEGSLENLEGVPMRQELQDYIRLSKNSSLKRFLPISNTLVNENLEALNNKDSVTEFTANHRIDGDYLVTASTNKNIVKVNGVLYRKVGANSKSAVFGKVLNKTNELFFEPEMFFSDDSKTVSELLKNNNFGLPLSQEQKQENLKKSGVISTLFTSIKETSKRVRESFKSSPDKQFERNLVDFLKSRGVQIETDPAVMAAKLKELGFADLNAMIIGEQAAYKFENLSNSLDRAKKLVSENVDVFEVEQQTGWFKDPDGWKFYDKDLLKNINVPTDIQEGSYTLEQVIGANNKLFNLYPQLRDLKTEFYYGDERIRATESQDTGIRINLYTTPDSQLSNGPSRLSGTIEEGRFRGLRLSATLAHELSHRIQRIEGFSGGAGSSGVFGYIGARLSITDLGVLKSEIDNLLGKTELNSYDKDLLSVAKEELENFFVRASAVQPSYFRMAGEINARVIEFVKLLEDSKMYDSLSGLFTVDRNTYKMMEGVGQPLYGVSEGSIFKEKTQFLQTPAGEVLGFESNGKIYLDETKLNNTTTLHELIHVFQHVVDTKANKGDTKAKQIIEKRKELFEKEVEAWMEWHKGTSPVDVQNNSNFQIIGEENVLTEEDSTSLEKAKELFESGKPKEDIYSQTRWLKTNQGQWIREVGDLRFLPSDNNTREQDVNFLVENKKAEYSLDEWFDFSEFKTGANYTNTDFIIEYKDTKQDKVYGKAIKNNKGGYTIEVQVSGTRNFLRKVLAGENYGVENIRRFTDSRGAQTTFELEKNLESLVNHEFQHVLQLEGGRKVGNTPIAILDHYVRKNSNVVEKANPRTYEELAQVLGRVYNIENFLGHVEDLYRNSIGERQATEVELRLKGKDTLPEDFAGAYNIDVIDVNTDKANFQIIGEQGAANLDAMQEVAFRLDNLKVAREMEQAGKTPKEIRLATGWEKNDVTREWQFELQDNFTLKTLKIDNKKVGDILSFPELFNAHPQVKDVRIEIVPFEDADFDGNYQPNRDVIQISSYLVDEDSRQQLISILAHELHHKTQNLEGWKPSSRQDAQRYAQGVTSLGMYSPYSDIEDGSKELVASVIEDLSEYASFDIVFERPNENIFKLLKYYLENNEGIQIPNVEKIQSVNIDGRDISFYGKPFPANKDGLIAALKADLDDLKARNGVESKEEAEAEIKTVEKDSFREDDLIFMLRAFDNYENNLDQINKGNFTVKSTPSLSLSVKKVLEDLGMYGADPNTVSKDIEAFMQNNEMDEFDVYWRSQTEVEARNVQERLNMTPEQRRQTLLQETEDVSREDQIVLFNMLEQDSATLPKNLQKLKDTIGLDLSSPAYAQRVSESEAQYKDRLLKEVEAYVTAPEVAEQLENLKQENPSLWQQIMDYITQLTDWLKNKIGLDNYQGDVMAMSREQYVSALGVGALRMDYTTEMKVATQDFVSNQMAKGFQILNLPTEEKQQELVEDYDSCN